MARFTLSLPILRRSNAPASHPSAPATGAVQPRPAEGRRHGRTVSPMLGEISAQARETQVAGPAAPRNAAPLATRRAGKAPMQEPGTMTLADLFARSERMDPEHVASSSGTKPIVEVTNDDAAASTSAAAQADTGYTPWRGRGGWGMSVLRSLGHESPDEMASPEQLVGSEYGSAHESLRGSLHGSEHEPPHGSVQQSGPGSVQDSLREPEMAPEPVFTSRFEGGEFTLAEARVPEDGDAKAAVLLAQLASVPLTGDAGGDHAAHEQSSRTRGPLELGRAIAGGDALALATLTQLVRHAHQAARAAADTAAGGGMAGLVASGRDAGEMTTHLEAAGDHFDALELALNFADDEADGVAVARIQLDAARAAIATVRADFAHCAVQCAIDEHRLLPEAAVLGELAMLGTLRPVTFEAAHADHDGLAQLATRMSRDLRTMMTSSLDSDHATVGAFGTRESEAPGVSTLLGDAAARVAELRAACPPGAPAQSALAQLADAIRATRSWIDNGHVDGAQPRATARILPTDLQAAVAPVVATTPEAVTARMAEIDRQRAALGELPNLLARGRAELAPNESPAERDRALNDSITETIGLSFGPHTPVDTRIELARVAMHFTVGDGAERLRVARKLTSAALGIERPCADDVLQTLGEAGSGVRVIALYDRLGDVMAGMSPGEAQRFAQTFDETWSVAINPRQVSSVQHAAEAIATGRRPEQYAADRAVHLPDDPAWLGSSRQRATVVRDYLNQCSGRRACGSLLATDGHVDNRGPFRQILALASNMDGLRGHRHHLVAFAKELFAEDAGRIAIGSRPAVDSAQRYELLHAMVAQLPRVGSASGDRQTVADVMSLILQQLEKPQLNSRHKSRLAKDLIDIAGHLATSRYSGSDAQQSHALDAVRAGLKHLRGASLASLLKQLIASSEDLSDARSAHVDMPRTRGQKRSRMWSTVVPPFAAVSAAGFAWSAVTGRASPRSQALRVALEAIERDIAHCQKEGVAQSAAFRPIYREMLQSVLAGVGQADAKLDEAPRARLLSSVVQGTLPAEIDVPQRNQILADVVGDDPAMRATLVRTLVSAVQDRKAPANTPLGRIHAARYLQNLIAAFGSDLRPADLQAARAAIDRATLSKSADWTDAQQMSVLLTMARESQRDGVPVRPEAARAVAVALAATLRPAPTVTGAREIASHAADVVRLYPFFDAPSRNRLHTALAGIAPEQPEERGPATRNQLPLLNLAMSMAHFTGDAGDAAELAQLLRQVWPRLNATNQQAALHNMFDAYDEATPAGRDAVLAVVVGLDDGGQFASAAIRLVESAFPEGTQTGMPDRAEQQRVVDTVLNRMATLDGEHTSELASNLVRGGSHVPQALIDGFVESAAKLAPRTLAEVLSAELQRVGTLSVAQVADVVANWRDIADRMAPDAPQRDALWLYADIASQGYLGAQTRHDADGEGVAVSAEAAGQLLAALPSFTDSMQAVVLRHIAGESAPEDVRKSVVGDLFRDFAKAEPARRHLAIELGGTTAIGRGMEALAARFGTPDLHDGRANGWWDLEQPFIAAGGPDGTLKTLGSALRSPGRRPQEVGVVLEAIAARFQELPLRFREQFAVLLEEHGMQLPPLLRRRVIDTLAIANPSLAQEDEFSAIGRELLQRHAADGSNGLANARLRGMKINNAEGAIVHLRESRLTVLANNSA
ncbi:hypothetical protein [Paraburkholderia phosphatilytica]|uniref:hypothetical protein n=1 Tax=Paraburkholderia phosphatilytica TaxID=2282883 RepID=UPI000F5DA9E3|nr:hypothetical protein [Paraburkholderia phosphatilytica]